MDNISRHFFETAKALARTEAALVKAARTQYAVRLTSGVFASPNLHWTEDRRFAQTFDSLTAANAYAIMTLGLELTEFSAEAV
jgi:hypothetical protein